MTSPILIAGVVALLAVAFVYIGVKSRKRQQTADEVMERMGRFATRDEFLAVSDGGSKHAPSKMAQGIEEVFKGRPVADKTALLLTQADVRITVGEFLMLRIIAAGGGFAIGFLIQASMAPAFGLLLGVVIGFLGFILPSLYLGSKAKRRRKEFVGQLGDTITLMANSLRAGYSLLQTMDMVAKETRDPMAGEFRRVVREIGLGISHEDAMANLMRRVPSDDLDLLVTAINIQHEVGGNLAQILTTIGHTIRERVRIKGEINVLTAQVKFSGYIITAMPIGLAIIIFFLNPGYMAPLWTWPWVCMPIGSSIMIVFGFLIMRKIANIEV